MLPGEMWIRSIQDQSLYCWPCKDNLPRLKLSLNNLNTAQMRREGQCPLSTGLTPARISPLLSNFKLSRPTFYLKARQYCRLKQLTPKGRSPYNTSGKIQQVLVITLSSLGETAIRIVIQIDRQDRMLSALRGPHQRNKDVTCSPITTRHLVPPCQHFQIFIKSLYFLTDFHKRFTYPKTLDSFHLYSKMATREQKSLYTLNYIELHSPIKTG